MEDNKFEAGLENKTEETGAQPKPEDFTEAATAVTETAEVTAFWHRENNMGQFIQEPADNTTLHNELNNSQMQMNSDSLRHFELSEESSLPIKPLMWEDTPLFSFIGRYGDDSQNTKLMSRKSLKACAENIENNNQETQTDNGESCQESAIRTFETRPAEPLKPHEFILDGLTPPGVLFRESSPFDQTYKFINAPLPYNYDALEPYIDELTMQLHHNKHLQKYIDELNTALDQYPRYHNWRLERLLQMADTLPQQIRTAVINNGGGVYNHFFYFESLTDHPELKIMPPALNALLTSAFKSVADFMMEFKKKALSVFGSGYAWLILDPGGRPEITTTANQDTPLAKKQYPLLNIDVWEHAYYLKHHNMKDAYIDNWFNAVNWHEVGKRLSEIRIRR